MIRLATPETRTDARRSGLARARRAFALAAPTAGVGVAISSVRWCETAIAELTAGEPVDVARVADRADAPAEEVLDFLRGSPAELDRGRLVGFGLTLRPTPHRVELGGRTLYTWCTPDTLELPMLLGQPVRVESRCFATGEPVRVEVDPAGVRELEPDEAVLSMVLPVVCMSDFRQKLCDEQHFFSSATAAAGWHADRPKAIVVPVRSGFELTRLLGADAPPPVTPCSIFQRSGAPVNRNEDFPSELFRPVPGPVPRSLTSHGQLRATWSSRPI